MKKSKCQIIWRSAFLRSWCKKPGDSRNAPLADSGEPCVVPQQHYGPGPFSHSDKLDAEGHLVESSFMNIIFLCNVVKRQPSSCFNRRHCARHAQAYHIPESPRTRQGYFVCPQVATRRKPTTTTHFATPEESSNALGIIPVNYLICVLPNWRLLSLIICQKHLQCPNVRVAWGRFIDRFLGNQQPPANHPPD